MSEVSGNAEVPESLIANVSTVRLSELVASEDSNLMRSITEILGELERSATSISGWASYVE